VSLKIRDMGDETEEVTFNKFFLGNPKLFSVVIDDCILVWVAVDDVGASGSSEEVGEEVD